MKVVGIIAEFNPFHRGHEYLIDEAVRITGAGYCVIVMSGDFVQRGEPAVCDKYLRTRMALAAGADAVFELPVMYSCASAEQFAFGAMSLLAGLGCVDEVCFGSESGDIDKMIKIARILTDEPDEYRQALSSALKTGISFPAARQNALEEYLRTAGHGTEDEELFNDIHNGLLSASNNILGIEYCKAFLKLTHSGIHAPRPVTVRRVSSSYNSGSPDSTVDASALAVRKMLRTGDLSLIKPYVPSAAYSIMSEAYNKVFPVFPEDFDNILYTGLLELADPSCADRRKYSAIPADLHNSLLKQIDGPVSFYELADRLKTKNNTYTAVCRALVSIILHTDCRIPEAQDFILPYARLLGIREQSSQLVRSINKNASCEIINKLADASNASEMLAADIKAARLYNQVIYKKFGTRQNDEYRKTIEIL